MADLVVEFGANVQPGQRVHVGASVGQEALARAIAARCYRAGGGFVDAVYGRPWGTRGARCAKVACGARWGRRAGPDEAVDEALGHEPGWVVQMMRELGEERGAT